jgi:hypothetical protein
VTECIEGLTLKHTKQGEFRFSLCNQKVENYPVVFESFRVGSAKPKLAGSIPALPTSRKAILVMCHGGNQTTLLFLG